MLRGTSWICLSLILAGWLVAAPAVEAQKKDPRSDPARKVNDEAELFGKDAIRTANEEIASIKSAYKKDVLIETREKGPAKDKFEAWAEEQAKSHRVEGVYIVITKEPKHFDVLVGNATIRKGTFTTEDRTAVRDILKKNLREQPDEALLKTVRYIRNAMRDNTGGKVGAAPVTAPANAGRGDGEQPQQKHGFSLFGLGLGGLICVGIVGLLAVWLVFGLIRALTNRGAGAPGYGGGGGGGGPGYGGGYGGGGGGGFLTSLVGGMFGAAAGMWAYNNFFGGHTASSYGAGGMGGAAAGGDYGGAAPEPTDVGSGYSGSGGDYGDAGGDKDIGGGDKDIGGGDAGGGDWGGGGDAGGGDAGGGDWGGGGGDFGGGGGGDFGGGGGGGGDW